MRLFYNQSRWIFYGLFALLTSCVSMEKISIQVSTPPPRAISNDIQSIVLMNRSMTSAFKNLNQDSLENILVSKKLSLDELLLDSLAADTTLQVLGHSLYESGRFDVVIPLQRNLQNTNVSYLTKSSSLKLPQVKQVCDEFKVDALLSLENFYENVSTYYQTGYGNVSEYGVSKEYVIFVQIAFHSNWKLYQPGEKLKIATFEVRDTIFWERTGPSLQATYEKIPTIKEALLNGAIENGQILASYISPGWKQQTRSYFITKNTEADKAVALLKSNKWKEAQDIWMKFSTSSSTTLRSQIEFNLALASEMEGDLKKAIEWTQKSFKTKYSKASEDYLMLLNKLLNSR